MSVFSGIVGESIPDFCEKEPQYIPQIFEGRDKILEGLQQLGINHGHPNLYNFCIKKRNDTIQIFLIDWDRANVNNQNLHI